MRRFFTHTITCCLLLISHSSLAQKYFGNEWINSAQTYLKISVAQTGLYHITRKQLVHAGVPVDQIASGSYQMFRRGKELAIEIKEDSGRLGENSYITFYGEKNNGDSDSLLYTSSGAMPHSHYSLYSDTAAYFLTWRVDGGIGIRMQESPVTHQSTPIGHHFEETLQLFTNHYLPGNFYPPGSNFENGSVLTAYDYGEGWTGPELGENKTFGITFHIENPAKVHFGQAEIEILIAGWSAGRHLFEIWIEEGGSLKRKLGNVFFENYGSQKLTLPLRFEDIDPGGKIKFSIVPVDKGGHISISYARLRYPSQSTSSDISNQRIFHFNAVENGLWKVNPSNKTTFYDCSDPLRVRKLARTNEGVYIGKARKMITAGRPIPVAKLDTISFAKLKPNTTDYLIVSHPMMHKVVHGIDPVAAYAQYRTSKEGGNCHVLVMNSAEVYDQFNYGDRSPQAIRNLIYWLHQTGELKFVFLIGHAIDPQKARKLSDPQLEDMVPNAGWPGSDVALAMDPRDSASQAPIVPIGRLNARNSGQVYDYLFKVKGVESQAVAAPWRKNILHLSGGRSREQLALFNQYLKGFERKLKSSTIGVSVQTIAKFTDDPVEKLPIHIPVNQGVGLLTLFGHSSLDVTDIDIGLPSDLREKYENHPRYPAIIVNGCASGSIFYSDKTLSSDWILTPGSGAVLFLAHTFNGLSTSLKKYTEAIYEVLADPAFESEPFGAIQQEAIRRNMQRNPDIYDRITAQQMNLHGDPAIRIFPARLPDYSFESSSVRFSDKYGGQLQLDSDSIRIRLIARNHGRFRKENYVLSMERILEDRIIYSASTIHHAMPNADTLFFLLPNIQVINNAEKWKFSIDGEQLLPEENENNNALSVSIPDVLKPDTNIPDQIPPIVTVNIDGRQLANLETVSARPIVNISLSDQNLAFNDTTSIVVWLKQKCNGCTEKRIFLHNAIWAQSSDRICSAQLPFSDVLQPGTYLLSVLARDRYHNFAPLYQIQFQVGKNPEILAVSVSPSPSDSWFKVTVEAGAIALPGQALFQTFDNSGRCVFKKDFPLHNGINECFWHPLFLPAGLYLYKITLPESITDVSPIARKGLQGRLIWIR